MKKPIKENEAVLSLNPATFANGQLATSLGGNQFNEAVNTVWRPIGNRDERRSDTKATVHMLKTAMLNVTPTDRGNNYIERLASLGGCDLVKSDQRRKEMRKLVMSLRRVLDYATDYSLHNDIYAFTSDVSLFRWDIGVDRHLKKVRIELWSPLVKDEFVTAAVDFVAPTSVVVQVFQCKWLISSQAPLGSVPSDCLNEAIKAWEKRCKEFSEKGLELMARCEKLKLVWERGTIVPR